MFEDCRKNAVDGLISERGFAEGVQTTVDHFPVIELSTWQGVRLTKFAPTPFTILLAQKIAIARNVGSLRSPISPCACCTESLSQRQQYTDKIPLSRLPPHRALPPQSERLPSRFDLSGYESSAPRRGLGVRGDGRQGRQGDKGERHGRIIGQGMKHSGT